LAFPACNIPFVCYNGRGVYHCFSPINERNNMTITHRIYNLPDGGAM
jgi:hypothetical protein